MSAKTRQDITAGEDITEMTGPAVAELRTVRDLLRYAVSRFSQAGLSYGHGTTNVIDEAAYIVLESLQLPIDNLDPFLDARLLERERRHLADLIERRVTERKPASYLLNRAYIKGIPFYVDERAIVPRSYIGELLFSGLFDPRDGSCLADPDAVGSVLDLCTGSGALAIVAAHVFPDANIDAVDLSSDALEVARRNVSEHGLEDRISLFEGDLFAPLAGRRYDLILTNPPYVDAEAMADLPREFRQEPEMALAGGEDGLDVVRQILRAAPGYLAPGGGMMCEIGTGRELLEDEFPGLAFMWLDSEESSGEVFWITAGDMNARQ